MAAGSAGSGTGDLSRVTSLLREAVDLIQNSSPPTARNVSSRNDSSGSTSQGTNVNTIQQNLQSLFGPYRRSGFVPSSSLQVSKSNRRWVPYNNTHGYKVKDTWTHEFFCLAEKDYFQIPNKQLKIDLKDAGLGRKKLVFPAKADATKLKSIIEEAYPKLKSGGGFDILRSGVGELVLIKPPANGYDVPYLRDESGLGQAIAYVRPIQKNLDTAPVQDHLEAINTSKEAEGRGPRVSCLNCGLDISMNEVRKHNESCNGGGSSMGRSTTVENGPENGPQSCDNSKSVVDLTQVEIVNDDLQQLRSMFPDLSEKVLRDALTESGSVRNAVDALLPKDYDEMYNLQDLDLDVDNLPSLAEVLGSPNLKTPIEKLNAFRDRVILSDAPTQLFKISRLDGRQDMQSDILTSYKNPKTNLRAPIKIRFEQEDGVGSGPVREFFNEAVSIVEEGFGSPKSLLFEGRKDHKIPVHSPIMRQTGAFKMAGKIIGHSVLHGGPGLVGLAPSIKHYLCTKDMTVSPPPLDLMDLSDYSLYEYLVEVDNTSEELPEELKNQIMPYIMEAGLELTVLRKQNRKLLVQAILMFFIIDKRRLELDEIIKGMEEVSLHSFLCEESSLASLVFPSENEREVSLDDLKKRILNDNDQMASLPAVGLFEQYLTEISHRKKGGAQLADLLCFWTGSDTLPSENRSLNLKLDDGSGDFPTAETCFLILTIPTKHHDYERFKSNMDLALMYGSKGFSFT